MASRCVEKRRFHELRTAKVITSKGYRYVSGTDASFPGCLLLLIRLCLPEGGFLTVLADGAHWIGEFFTECLHYIEHGELILDWYHLVNLLAFAQSEAQEITDDLVLAFSFEDGAGNAVLDRSFNGNDGKIEGNANWVDGKLGKALQFDGETYVVAPHIPLDDRDFTVQLWVKSEMITEQETVFTQHELNAANLSLHLRLYNTGIVRMGFYSNDLDGPDSSVKKGQWHNLTFVFDQSNSTRTIYVDGVEIISEVSGSAYLGTTGDTLLGVWARPSKPPLYQVYHGAIDEVRVWHRLMDEEEILLSMETEMAVEPQGKVAIAWGAVKNNNMSYK